MSGLRCSLLALALMGCSTASPPGIKVEYVDRPVVVEKPCLDAKDVPQRPGRLGATQAPGNVETALSVALAKISEWTRYGNQADPLLKSCSK